METSTPRSVFVTVVAWQGIVFASLCVLAAAMQVLMMATIPGFGGQLFLSEMGVYMMGTYGLTLLALLASIGLLRRKNWARLIIIALLIAAILYVVGGLYFEWGFVGQLSHFGPPMDADFSRMAHLMTYFMIFVTALVSMVFGWLATKLGSKSVRAEFVAHGASGTGP